MRRVVNELLNLRGAPAIVVGGHRGRLITYSDILIMLQPLNEGREARHWITYDSLWVHAKRHYDLAGIAAHWEARTDKKLRNAFGVKRSAKPIA